LGAAHRLLSVGEDMTERLFRHSTSAPGPGEWTVIVASGAAIRRGLLGVALETVGRLGTPAHTLCVIGRADRERARSQLGDRCDHLVVQPSSVELCGGLFVALAMVQRWAPHALVTTIVLAADDDEPDPIIVCDEVAELMRHGRASAPALLEVLDSIQPLLDTDDEDAGLEAVFSMLPYVDVRELFPRAQPRAAVSMAVFASALI
jgi:hypothetical protein